MSCISLLEKRIIVALFFLSITLCVALFFYPPFTPIFSLFPPILRRLPVVFLSLFFFFLQNHFVLRSKLAEVGPNALGQMQKSTYVERKRGF